MKATIILIFVLIFNNSAYSQNVDLIVNMQGDSIVCKIDSVTDSHIFFNAITKSGSVQQVLTLDLLKSYSYHSVSKEQYTFRNGIATLNTIDNESYEDLKMRYSRKSYNNLSETHPISSKVYSIENLQNASNEELGYYLFKAKKLKKTGTTITIIGLTIGGIGMIKFISKIGYIEYVYPFLAGVPITIIGIAMSNNASSRENRIHEIKSSFSDAIFFGC